MPFIRHGLPSPTRGERISRRLLEWYRLMQPVYGVKRARQKVRHTIESERLREWSEEHGKRGRQR